MNGYKIPVLPPETELETKPVLRQLAKAHRALAELKGYVATLALAKSINAEMEAMTAEIRERLPRIYSRELMDLLFYEFYTRIAYIAEGLSVSRKTAANYLATLEDEGFLVSEKLGKERIYQNKRLFDLVRK